MADARARLLERAAAGGDTCDECGRTVPKGATYVHKSQLFDGSWATWKLCLRCDRAWDRAHDRGALVDIDWEIGEGPDYGQLADYLREWRAGWRWARAFRDQHPRMRIALCGYEEEHAPHMPASWSVYAWSANGGAQRRDGGAKRARANRHRERIWFSPACLTADVGPLFAEAP